MRWTRVFLQGNENIYALLNDGRQYKLRFDLADFNGTTRYAEYDNFKLGSSWDKYKAVSVGGYSGTAGTDICKFVLYNFSKIQVSCQAKPFL